MITINLYYTGENGSARAFAEEMVRSGTAAAIREEDGNLRYEYFFPMDDPETVRTEKGFLRVLGYAWRKSLGEEEAA